MGKRNRKLALLLALAVCFVMLFSVFYIAAEADHDCIGEDCPICYQIRVCETTLTSLGHGALVLAAVIALTFSAVILFSQPKTHLRQSTLITLKVKLSN